MDAGRVLALWNQFYPRSLRVDEDLLRFNFFDCPLAMPHASLVLEDGFVLVKASAVGRLWGEGPATSAHVSAISFSSSDVASRLVSHVRAAVGPGVGLVFGQDWRHFFPGVPRECAVLAEGLESAGFRATEEAVYDVGCDISSYRPPVVPTPFARPCDRDDRAALEEFFWREFPGRWRVDVMEKFDESPQRVTGLFMRGLCEGFAMTQMDGDAHRRAGAVWSQSLGLGWAALGPIGVSARLRGQGLGDGLLARALCLLRDQGARKTVIDWTVLRDFYGKHGFRTVREYRAMRSE